MGDAMGCYATNINRFVELFGSESIVFVETKELSTLDGLRKVVERIGARVPAVAMLAKRRKAVDEDVPWLNRAAGPQGGATSSESETMKKLKQYYCESSARLYAIVGRNLGWD